MRLFMKCRFSSFLRLSLPVATLLLVLEAPSPPTTHAQYAYEGPKYGLPWQGLPHDIGLGLHVRAGDV